MHQKCNPTCLKLRKPFILEMSCVFEISIKPRLEGAASARLRSLSRRHVCFLCFCFSQYILNEMDKKEGWQRIEQITPSSTETGNAVPLPDDNQHIVICD